MNRVASVAERGILKGVSEPRAQVANGGVWRFVRSSIIYIYSTKHQTFFEVSMTHFDLASDRNNFVLARLALMELHESLLH